MLIQFELKRAHFIIISVAAIVGFVIGYLVGIWQCDSSPLQKTTYTAVNKTEDIVSAANKIGTKEGRIVSKAVRELELTTQQQEQIMAIVFKNFPTTNRTNASIDITQVYETLKEIKPILTDEQSQKLDALVVQYAASGQWK